MRLPVRPVLRMRRVPVRITCSAYKKYRHADQRDGYLTMLLGRIQRAHARTRGFVSTSTQHARGSPSCGLPAEPMLMNRVGSTVFVVWPVGVAAEDDIGVRHRGDTGERRVGLALVEVLVHPTGLPWTRIRDDREPHVASVNLQVPCKSDVGARGWLASPPAPDSVTGLLRIGHSSRPRDGASLPPKMGT